MPMRETQGGQIWLNGFHYGLVQRQHPIRNRQADGVKTMDELIILNRRELLTTATGLLTGLVVAGSPLALIARGLVWAIDLAALTTSEGTTLMAVSRTIMPHDKLDDAAYALVIRAVDLDASKDDSSRKIIKDGLASLGPGFA